MSMPVWPGKKPRLIPIFGGVTVKGQASFGTFLVATVTVGAPVDERMLGVWSSDDSVDADGGVGEPDAAFASIGTGSLLLAAVSGAGARAGSGLVEAGISSRCPAFSVASSAMPLTAAMPVLDTE